MSIDKSALIDKTSEISQSAEIAPNVYIGKNCKIGDNVKIGYGAYIDKNTTIGSGTHIFANAHLGAEPQDTSYRGEETKLIIGKDCMIREFAPIHRATAKETWETVIGDRVYVMTLAHIGHDCHIDNDCIIISGAMIGGHCKLFDHVTIGGDAIIHQFSTIGSYAMIGGGSAIRSDVAPYCLTTGNPSSLESLNIVGLRRANISVAVRIELKKAFRILVDTSYDIKHIIDELSKLNQSPEIEIFTKFITNIRRPLLRKHRALGEKFAE